MPDYFNETGEDECKGSLYFVYGNNAFALNVSMNLTDEPVEIGNFDNEIINADTGGFYNLVGSLDVEFHDRDISLGYTPEYISLNESAIARLLGCTPADLVMYGVDANGFLDNNSTAKGTYGYWMKSDGTIDAFESEQTSWFSSYYAGELNTMWIGHMPNYFKGIGDEECRGSLYFMYGNNIFAVNVYMNFAEGLSEEVFFASYDNVATEDLFVSIIPSNDTYTDETMVTDLNIDKITELLGTSSPTLYGLAYPKEEGSPFVTYDYSCDPNPGFWMDLHGFCSSWDSNGYNSYGMTYANGIITWYQYPGAQHAGAKFNSKFYLVNPSNGKMITYNVTVEYIEEIKYYTITFIVNNEVYATLEFLPGTAVSEPEKPKKVGHSFTGWQNLPKTMPAENIVVEGFFIEGYHDVAAGTLSEMFSGVSDVDSLTVSGSLNGTDIAFIRSMPKLCCLDLSGVNIVSGGNPYNEEGNTTANNVVGDGMFAGLAKLRTLYLPATATKVGQGIVSSETLRELHWSSNAAISDGIVDDADVPTNMIVYAPSSVAGSYSGNIVFDGVAEEIVLTDEVPLHISSGFKAKSISYTRHFDKETVPHKPGGWESIILPFDVQSFVSEEDGDIAPFNSGNSGAKPFMLAQMTASGFAVSSAMKANVPYIIAMPNSSVYDDQDNISGNVTFMSQSAEGVPVLPTSAAQTAAGKEFDLVPAFETVERSFSVYALNDGTYNDLIPGSAFVSGLREIRPFEAYASVESKPANAKTHFVIGDDGTATDIQRLYDSLFGSLKVECHNGVLYIFSSEVQTIGLYSSDGRLVRLMELEAGKNAVTGLPEGVYFVGNKKVVVK